MVTGSKIRLRNKRLADAEYDYIWQTDHELVRLDATVSLTLSFPQYVSTYAGEVSSISSTRCQFAIETLDGKHIGNCGYYHLDETVGEAELGIMIGNRDYWNRGFGADAIMTLVDHIFGRTKLKRIYLKTLEWNTRAQKCFKKCGFISYEWVGKDGSIFVFMEMYKMQWEECQKEA